MKCKKIVSTAEKLFDSHPYIMLSGKENDLNSLAMKGISFTPAVLTLISLSIMSFGNVFTQNVSLIIVLLVFAGFSVKWILNKDISFKSDFYENEMSQWEVEFMNSKILLTDNFNVLEKLCSDLSIKIRNLKLKYSN